MDKKSCLLIFSHLFAHFFPLFWSPKNKLFLESLWACTQSWFLGCSSFLGRFCLIGCSCGQGGFLPPGYSWLLERSRYQEAYMGSSPVLVLVLHIEYYLSGLLFLYPDRCQPLHWGVVTPPPGVWKGGQMCQWSYSWVWAPLTRQAGASVTSSGWMDVLCASVGWLRQMFRRKLPPLFPKGRNVLLEVLSGTMLILLIGLLLNPFPAVLGSLPQLLEDEPGFLPATSPEALVSACTGWSLTDTWSGTAFPLWCFWRWRQRRTQKLPPPLNWQGWQALTAAFSGEQRSYLSPGEEGPPGQ